MTNCDDSVLLNCSIHIAIIEIAGFLPYQFFEYFVKIHEKLNFVHNLLWGRGVK